MGNYTKFKYFNNNSIFCCKRIRGKDYIGYAYCNPEDEYSQRLGERLAANRASIEYLCAQRDSLIEQRKSLRHLRSIFERSSKANSESYEFKMVMRQLKKIEEDIEDLRYVIKEAKEVDKRYVETRIRILEKSKTNSNDGGSV